MHRSFVIAVGSLGTVLTLSSTLAAQTGVLSGAIFDQVNNTGLAGVTVKVPGTDLLATTGRDGRFTITGVPSGTRQIEAVRTGYHPYRLTKLRVVENDTAFIYVALAPAPLEVGPSISVRTETPLGSVSANAPIYIVDGVVLAAGSIPDIPTSSIESVEVVRGAAAVAMWGERAASGVIVVKTKR